MKSAQVAELKARLSHFLRLVRKGEEVVVLDRRQPIAKLVRFSADDHIRLAIRRAEKDPALLAKLRFEPLRDKRIDSLSFLLEERQNHR